MNVYIVHWGEYSDSGIVGVFAEREDAEAVAKARNTHARERLGYGVTEYEVKGGAIDPPKWYAKVSRDYAKYSRWIVDDRLYETDTDSQVGCDFFYPPDPEYGLPDDFNVWVGVWVEVDPETFDSKADKKRLIKIAQDRFAQWKAEQAGIA